ncbi:TonB-dependent receptor [Mucilaginibacter pallidiroseus]|uniref:TonB-dependent receptor n=1 Tax=Mucilaginibacter pallidiroseus TaxID=2599295 RepID=A0A563U7U0_9SPHI|nr:outer membrane beta-barrel family protein [Mucilaginibacter pallidiroseus]TWR27442.1 TonB-dependent receptor [Mucilaginibacter pallidiroseus]
MRLITGSLLTVFLSCVLMRLITGSLLTVFLSCVLCICLAQPVTTTLKGNVALQNNQPAAAATVILLNRADSAVVSSALVGSMGTYAFNNIKPGIYIVLVTRLGYQKYYSPAYNVISGRQTNAEPIILLPESTQLKEVAITAKTPFVEVRPGKTVINPQASITAEGKSALDILRQSPGVKVDNNDVISVSGRQRALVMVDGKATNLTGSDLAALLRSTPGNNIERMEILSGGTSKYDASAGGIINIVLKKGKNVGTNGTISLGAGYGTFYKSNAGISFNHRTKSVNIYASYNFTNNKTFREIVNDRDVTNPGLTSNYRSAYHNIQVGQTNYYRAGADFFLSPKHTVGVLVTGFSNNFDFKKDNRLDIKNNSVLDSTVLANSTIDRKLHNVNYNVNYTGTLDKAGKTLAANITYSPYGRNNDEYIDNWFYNAAGQMYRSPLLLQNLSKSTRYNWTGMLDFTSPIAKTGRFASGVKLSKSRSDNSLIFGPLVGNSYTVDPNFSNQFIYNEDVGAAYADYSQTIGKVDLQAGLRAEYTKSKGNSISSSRVIPYNYLNLFPSLLLNYKKDDKNEYSLAYSRGLERPIYDNLNPFLVYLDPYNYQQGNPYLRPEYNHTIKLSHTYNKDITTSLYASFITNGNFSYYVQNDSTGINLATRRNLGKAYYYGVTFNAPVTFNNWWTATFDADLAYQKYVVYLRYGNFSKGSGYLVLNTSQNFTISKTIAAEIAGHYESSAIYGITRFKPVYYINAGISKQLFNKLGKLTLNANDIFNVRRDRGNVNFNNLRLSIYDKTETRYFKLDFTYRFGKKSVKAAARRNVGNEAEQKRLNQ